MKLRRLWLGKFLNFENLELHFDESSSVYGSTQIRFFIGSNGSGKSNVLEALGSIFAHLSIGAPPNLAFELEYELNDQFILITTQEDKVRDLIGRGDHLRLRASQIKAFVFVRPTSEAAWKSEHIKTSWSSSETLYLPSRIVGYSTGPTSNMQWALANSIEQLVRNQVGTAEREDYSPMTEQMAFQDLKELRERELNNYLDDPRSLFMGANDALCAVLPLLFSEPVLGGQDVKYSIGRQAILNSVGIDPIRPLVAFTFRVSRNWRQKLTPKRLESFTQALRCATILMPIDFKAEEVEADTESNLIERDFYAVFNVNQSSVTDEINSICPSPLHFFEDLLAWKRQGAVEAIRLVVRKTSVDDVLLENRLSDGEFLYLGRYALLLMLRNLDGSLVMLDEPETYFNDRWKSELVKMIYQLLGATLDENGNNDRLIGTTPFDESKVKVKNEVLIATHSDLTLTDADPRQIYVFENGQIMGPPTSPFAANMGEVTRALFGTEEGIGSFSREYLDARLEDDRKEVLEWLLRDIIGPGFYRFQLRDRIAELEDTPEKEKSNAPSHQ